jgi:hypothetical protein
MKKSQFARVTLCVVALLFALGPQALAHNCHVDTFPYWDGNITTGWLATAQVIVPPPNCTMLVEYAFELAGRSSPGSVQFSIYEWSTSGPVGNALFTTTIPWDTTASVIVVSNINLKLTSGTHYGAMIDMLGYTGQSVYFQYNQTGYPRGMGFWYNGTWIQYDGLNHRFKAKWAKAQ